MYFLTIAAHSQKVYTIYQIPIKHKSKDGESKRQAKATANRGQCKPGASSAPLKITPELHAESLPVGSAGLPPLYGERMMVR